MQAEARYPRARSAPLALLRPRAPAAPALVWRRSAAPPEAPIPDRQVLREVTPEIVAELRALLAAARSATIATLAPADGWPIATRVGLALLGREPLILVSALAAHTAALRADPRCSLLVGEPGKGDPLAHPRATLRCRAAEIPPASLDHAAARAAYLAANPKARLYADLPDFAFMRLAILEASYNAGFGKAYSLDGAQLTAPP